MRLIIVSFFLSSFSAFSQEKNYVVQSSQTFEYVNNELFVYHSIMFNLGAGDICPQYAYYSFDELSNDVNLNVAYSLIGVWPTFFCERRDTFSLQLPEGTYDLTVCIDIIDTDSDTQVSDTTNFSCDFYPSYLLGLNEVILGEKAITIYPNPVSTSFSISSNKNLEIITANLFDTFGRMMKIEYDELLNVEVSGLKSGTYFLELHTSKGLFRKKIIKL